MYEEPLLCVCACYEYGTVSVCSVPEFEANKYPVTNREFLEFVKDGGYQKKELWNEEGEVDASINVCTVCVCVLCVCVCVCVVCVHVYMRVRVCVCVCVCACM